MAMIASSEGSLVEHQNWSLLQKLVGIIISPNQTLKYLADTPDWVTPTIATIISGMLTAYAIIPRAIDATSMSGIPETAMRIALIVSLFSTPLITVAGLLVTTLLFHVVGSAFKRIIDFKSTLSVIGYANLPNITKRIVSAAIIAITGKTPSTSGLKGFMMQGSNPNDFSYLKALLSNIDVFSLWSLLLTIIGCSVLFRFSFKQSAAIVISLSLLGVILQGVAGGFPKPGFP
jgi:hypothetical protein